MEFNKHVVQGKWREFKGELQKAWGRLTDDEIEATKGDANAIGGLIEQKYGKKREEVETSLNDLYERFKSAKDDAAESAKDQLRN